MPPKYVFNYVMLYDDDSSQWRVYHKLDKRIPKTCDCYGPSYICSGNSESICLKNAEKKGVNSWDVQVIYPKNFENDFPENQGSSYLKTQGSD